MDGSGFCSGLTGHLPSNSLLEPSVWPGQGCSAGQRLAFRSTAGAAPQLPSAHHFAEIQPCPGVGFLPTQQKSLLMLFQNIPSTAQLAQQGRVFLQDSAELCRPKERLDLRLCSAPDFTPRQRPAEAPSQLPACSRSWCHPSPSGTSLLQHGVETGCWKRKGRTKVLCGGRRALPEPVGSLRGSGDGGGTPDL